jgi:MFS family permease
MPLAALGGGTAVGQLIAWKDFPVMFAVLGATWIVLPLAAWQLENCSLADRTKGKAKKGTGKGRVDRAFYLVILAIALSTLAISVGRLGTSLSMQALAFSPSSVASTATISGLLTVPVVLLLGPLSDRLNRRHILAFGYLLVGGGVVTLAVATQLWHFWLAATLLLTARCVNGAMGAALATDMLAPEELVRGLSWINAMGWASGVLSFAIGGYLVNRVGAEAVYVTASLLAVVAAIQLEWRNLRPPWGVPKVVEIRTRSGEHARQEVTVHTTAADSRHRQRA